MDQKYLYCLAVDERKPIRIGDLTWMIAKAIHPDDDFVCACAHINIKADVERAVALGEVMVRNPLDMGPHTFPYGAALEAAVLLPHEIKPLLDARSIELKLVSHPKPPKVPDRNLLATREELVSAFGSFTGMSKQWFERLDDKPQLKAARVVTGQGQRGQTIEPLFCPFKVMQWLLNPKRRMGREISEEKAWELLESYFSRVYAAHSVADPRGQE